MLTAVPARLSEASTDLVSVPQLLDQCVATAVIVLDELQQIIAYTPEAQTLVGIAPQEALGRKVAILPSPLREVIQKTLSTGESIVDRQILLPNPSVENPLTLRVTTNPTIFPNRSHRGAVAVLRNVTSARQLDQNLRRLDRLASIGTLSASMAHEI